MKLISEPHPESGSVGYRCDNCGVFRISNTADIVLKKRGFEPNKLAQLSYAVRRMGGNTLLTSDLLESILQDTKLPDASTLQDNLLLFMQSELAGPGEVTELYPPAMRACLGALSDTSARWVIGQALSAQLIEGTVSQLLADRGEFNLHHATLTTHGWARVEELLRSANGSQTVRTKVSWQ